MPEDLISFPLSGYATRLHEDGLLLLELTFLRQDQHGQVETRGTRLSMTAAQATELGRALLKSSDTVRTAQSVGKTSH